MRPGSHFQCNARSWDLRCTLTSTCTPPAGLTPTLILTRTPYLMMTQSSTAIFTMRATTRTFIADEVVPSDDPIAGPEASTEIGVKIVDACGRHELAQGHGNLCADDYAVGIWFYKSGQSELLRAVTNHKQRTSHANACRTHVPVSMMPALTPRPVMPSFVLTS